MNIRHARWAAAAAALAGLLPLAAAAQQPPVAVHDAVMQFLQRETVGLPGEVELTVGALDAGNQLPPCAALEPFLPAGSRAWGRTNVGVRCDSPVTWTVYLPARVAVMTDYLVTAQPLSPGQIVGPGDVARKRGDLAAQPDGTLTEPTQAVGYKARYAIAAGKPLRADMLRIPPAVRQGQTVRVVSTGEGFQVSSEGQALNGAAAGEPVRVRMGNGQVVSGTARDGGVVEVAY
jgi:flagella basal body P-ring formation protein FlgA